ncbi:MAG: HDIG domain-containing protein [Paludibacteraceae bacterium]|nr:HDIG domain-containing protein [Paludibacteraceae bacterium]
MKNFINEQSLKTASRILFFIISLSIFVQLFPRKGGFKYTFSEGKPWAYELLTAPFDFPIYKTKEVLQSERKDVMKDFAPFYKMKNVEWEAKLGTAIENKQLRTFLMTELAKIYNKGIVETIELDSLQKKNYQQICVVDNNNRLIRKNVDSLFNVRTAYNTLLKQCQTRYGAEISQFLNLNEYIKENLEYDRNLSEKDKKERLRTVGETAGMVQAGERIIDKGEIITAHTYQLLNSLRIESDKQEETMQGANLMLIGEILIITMLMILLYLYLYLFRRKIYKEQKNIIFILLIQLLIGSITALVIRFSSLSIYIVPFALLPIIIRTFFDSRTALFVHIITIFILSTITNNPFEFTLLQISGGMMAVSCLKDLSSRDQLAKASFYIFINYIVVYVGYTLLIEGSFTSLNWELIICFAISSILLLFAYGLVYLLEKIFGMVSNITLVELANVNTPLMQEFSEKAPGTFQHALQVANLVTEACKKINGNTLLARIGAMYHDIGKMNNPLFFTENQLNGNNPLEKLTYLEASTKIIAHVSDGVEIAKKHNLPKIVIDFIKTHHGEGHAKYFYIKYLQENPNAKISDTAFRYQGPSPRTKEQAILMMADAVEAASRSMKEYTEESIKNLVDTIIDGQINEGLLRYAKITFIDVETVKQVFKEKLITIHHTRIEYPKNNN